MNTNSFAFDSQFSIGLYDAVVDEFLSVMGVQNTSHEVVISPHQLSVENATQLAQHSPSAGMAGIGQYGAIAPAQPILAQQFEEANLGQQVQESWSNFVESGQVWALCIGVLFGYMFRTFTGG